MRWSNSMTIRDSAVAKSHTLTVRSKPPPFTATAQPVRSATATDRTMPSCPRSGSLTASPRARFHTSPSMHGDTSESA
jgi:hypothetical protein